MDRQVAKLVDLIDKKYAAAPGKLARSMDFAQKTQFWGLDCVGDFVFGEPIGFLTRDEDIHRFVEMNDMSLRMVTVAGLVPSLVGFKSTWPLSSWVP